MARIYLNYSYDESVPSSFYFLLKIAVFFNVNNVKANFKTCISRDLRNNYFRNKL